MTRRKPTKATLAAVEMLRDQIAAFCRKHGGVIEPGPFAERQYNPVLKGTIGATWTVPTRFGRWLVHEPADPLTGLVSINTRFEEPDRMVVADLAGDARFNRHSGKWNHHFDVSAVPTAMLDFERRARGLFSDDDVIASCCTQVRRPEAP